MKKRHDLVCGLLRKADSDLANAALCIENQCALDTACFHCQQAAEKALKAVLTDTGTVPPRTHNVEQLAALAAEHSPSFEALIGPGAELTPFAVGVRYDLDFWPTLADAREALTLATTIKDLCAKQLEGLH